MEGPTDASRSARPAIALGQGVSDERAQHVDAIIAALRARDFATAAERSHAAVRRHPNDAQLRTLQGIALLNTGKSSQALDAFQQALTIDPDHIAALEGAAQLHYQAGQQLPRWWQIGAKLTF